MKRRTYLKTTGAAVAALQFGPHLLRGQSQNQPLVRLGGPLYDPYEDPGQWVQVLKGSGYRAAYCPVGPDADHKTVRAYEEAARKHDVVIAEVGAWSNLISPDQVEAKEALEKCIAGLDLADRIGAMCCVNISGSKNAEHWAGPHEDNLTDEVFDLVVETTRKIIDAVKPSRSCFALEAMPWSFPYSTGSYLRLLKAIDRDGFGVHLDPVNMITSPKEYFENGQMIREMFKELGPHIKSCHAKDITLREDNYIPQLDELRPGLGKLDYNIYLRELSKLDNIPLMMEHLETAGEYKLAADHIRSVGKSIGINF